MPQVADQPTVAQGPAKDLLETLIPADDPFAEAMLPMQWAPLYQALLAQQPPLAAEVPRILHRVLLAEESVGNWLYREQWQAYASAKGYTLHEWRPEQVEAVTGPSTLATAIAQMRAAKRTDVAEQLTGLYALQSHGGILFGASVKPPVLAGEALDLSSMMSFHGITAATNLHGRTVGGQSFYLTTAWLAAPPRDPWVTAITSLAAANCLHLQQLGHLDWPSRYFAGNALLSRHAMIPIQLLPFTYLQQLGMFAATAESEDDAL